MKIQELLERYHEEQMQKRFETSFFSAMRPERRYRVTYIVKMGAELERIETQSSFAVAFGRQAIETLIEGDYKELQGYANRQFFDGFIGDKDQEANYNKLWERFFQLCEEAYENRPNQSLRKCDA